MFINIPSAFAEENFETYIIKSLDSTEANFNIYLSFPSPLLSGNLQKELKNKVEQAKFYSELSCHWNLPSAETCKVSQTRSIEASEAWNQFGKLTSDRADLPVSRTHNFNIKLKAKSLSQRTGFIVLHKQVSYPEVGKNCEDKRAGWFSELIKCREYCKSGCDLIYSDQFDQQALGKFESKLPIQWLNLVNKNSRKRDYCVNVHKFYCEELK